MLAPRAGRFLVPVGVLLLLVVALELLAPGRVPFVPFTGLVVALAALFVFFLIFFRDPDRPVGEGIVSAADGRVRAVERRGELWNVSVFMNVTDVHVNRFPIDGEVEEITTLGSGFRAAYRSDAERNVQRRYRLRTAIGPVEVVQITGVVARRLVSFVHVGSKGTRGARLGMIVLGSRVDVLLPADRVVVAVAPGERVWAGRSTIARTAP